MSNTPRTDAHAIKWESYWMADPIPTREQPAEWYEFCRTLERELDAAHYKANIIDMDLNNALADLAAIRDISAELTKERDEWKHKCEYLIQPRPDLESKWHAAYRDEHERRLKLQDALVEMDAKLLAATNERDTIRRQWNEREPQLRAAETDLDQMRVAYGELQHKLEALQLDNTAQCLLLGKSGSREAALLAKMDALRRHADAMADAMDWEVMSEGEEEALAAYRAAYPKP